MCDRAESLKNQLAEREQQVKDRKTPALEDVFEEDVCDVCGLQVDWRCAAELEARRKGVPHPHEAGSHHLGYAKMRAKLKEYEDMLVTAKTSTGGTGGSASSTCASAKGDRWASSGSSSSSGKSGKGGRQDSFGKGGWESGSWGKGGGWWSGGKSSDWGGKTDWDGGGWKGGVWKGGGGWGASSNSWRDRDRGGRDDERDGRWSKSKTADRSRSRERGRSRSQERDLRR